MKIAVLDYDELDVDIITVSEETIDKYGGVEDFLAEHCQYDLDNISWFAGDSITINELTDKSFGDDYEFKWEPSEKHFEWFDYKKGKFSGTQVILVNGEKPVMMDFYDGYAIGEDHGNRIVMLYPTLEETKRWETLLTGVLEYTSCEREEDITPYEVALKYGYVLSDKDK